MSRVGSSPITIPEGVTVTLATDKILVKGPKGELQEALTPKISVSQEGNKLVFKRSDDTKTTKSLHGLTRALVANMVSGVVSEYSKTLEMVGTGYRVNKQGTKLVLSVGFSHNVEYTEPSGIKLEVEENNIIRVSGPSKQQVGQVAAEIRKIRPPEPYKGKGIRYKGEHVRRKAGKAVKVGAGE